MISAKPLIYSFIISTGLISQTVHSNDSMITKALVSTCQYLFPEKQISATSLPSKTELLSFAQQTAITPLIYMLSYKISDYMFEKDSETTLFSDVANLLGFLATMEITRLVHAGIGNYNQTPEYLRAHGIGLLIFITSQFYQMLNKKS